MFKQMRGFSFVELHYVAKATTIKALSQRRYKKADLYNAVAERDGFWNSFAFKGDFDTHGWYVSRIVTSGFPSQPRYRTDRNR